MGLIAPAWYLAPRRPEVATTAWTLGAMLTGALGDGPVSGLNNPQLGVMLVQLAGEFADASTKARIWSAADEHFQPTWDVDAGEFTLGFGLNEDHPRGQWNARSMAGWVCTPGAWSDVFNRPNLAKFDEPTVVEVDFPRVAMSEARWDGTILHLAASPQNAAVRGTRTSVRLTNLDRVGADEWIVRRPDGVTVAVDADALELVVDGATYEVERRVSSRARN